MRCYELQLKEEAAKTEEENRKKDGVHTTQLNEVQTKLDETALELNKVNEKNQGLVDAKTRLEERQEGLQRELKEIENERAYFEKSLKECMVRLERTELESKVRYCDDNHQTVLVR